jgi:hypothetical protein
VKLYTADEYKTALDKARLHRWANYCEMGEYLLLPDYLAILYFFPNDPAIDGLRIVENTQVRYFTLQARTARRHPVRYQSGKTR